MRRELLNGNLVMYVPFALALLQIAVTWLALKAIKSAFSSGVLCAVPVRKVALHTLSCHFCY